MFSRFQRRLKIQAALFHNTARLLLESCLDHDVAIHMLEDESHPRWKDDGLDSSLAGQLDHSREACLGALEEINCILGELSKDSEGLERAVRSDEVCNPSS